MTTRGCQAMLLGFGDSVCGHGIALDIHVLQAGIDARLVSSSRGNQLTPNMGECASPTGCLFCERKKRKKRK